MKSQCVIRLAEEQARCRSCEAGDTELCACRSAGIDAVRMITLSQLWGVGALGLDRSLTVSAATTSKELRSIGQFRYRLLVERDGETCEHANGFERSLLEPVDAASLNLWVHANGRCLAVARVTQGADALADPRLAAMLRHSALPRVAYRTCLVLSRMAARQKPQAQALAPILARHAYRAGLETGATMALLATRPGQTEWFERLGFTPSGASWTAPGTGELRCLVLGLRDHARLEAVGSPLLAELDAFEADAPTATSQASILDLTGGL